MELLGLTKDFHSIPTRPGIRVWVGIDWFEHDNCAYHLWFTNGKWCKCNWGSESDVSEADDEVLKHFTSIAVQYCGGVFKWSQMTDEQIFG